MVFERKVKTSLRKHFSGVQLQSYNNVSPFIMLCETYYSYENNVLNKPTKPLAKMGQAQIFGQLALKNKIHNSNFSVDSQIYAIVST